MLVDAESYSAAHCLLPQKCTLSLSLLREQHSSSSVLADTWKLMPGKHSVPYEDTLLYEPELQHLSTQLHTQNKINIQIKTTKLAYPKFKHNHS